MGSSTIAWNHGTPSRGAQEGCDDCATQREFPRARNEVRQHVLLITACATKMPNWGHRRAALTLHCNHVGWLESFDREFDPAPQPLPAGRFPPTDFSLPGSITPLPPNAPPLAQP